MFFYIKKTQITYCGLMELRMGAKTLLRGGAQSTVVIEKPYPFPSKKTLSFLLALLAHSGLCKFYSGRVSPRHGGLLLKHETLFVFLLHPHPSQSFTTFFETTRFMAVPKLLFSADPASPPRPHGSYAGGFGRRSGGG